MEIPIAMTSPFESVFLCLATEKGLAVVRSLERIEGNRRCVVCSFAENNVQECYLSRIRSEALRLGLPFVRFADWQADPLELLDRFSIDAIICVGWKYRIPDQVTQRVNGNVIVAHDSLLPRLRGFAPLPTALITGESETGVTFLKAASFVDAGAIYWQSAVRIGSQDNIADLIQKLLPLYAEGVQSALTGRFVETYEQDESLATYSVWRDSQDYVIDWAESATVIERKIRALGSPYLGARSRVEDRTVILKRATILPDLSFAIRQPGKVWSLSEFGCPTVICGEGLLRIDEAEFEDGTSLLPMKRLRVRFA